MGLTDAFSRKEAIKSEELTKYLEESRGLERNFLREVLRSRRNAWVVTGITSCLAFCALMVTIVLIKTSAQPVPPFILRVDNATGAVDVLSVMRERQDSYGETVDQYWITAYIRHRENYDYETIQADYNAVGLMSTEQVAMIYHKVFEGDKGRDKVLSDKARILVQLDSAPIVNNETNTATARFRTIVHWRNNRVDEVRNWVATIAFKYVNAPMRSQDRLINPLGFQVTSYRVDPELVENK